MTEIEVTESTLIVHVLGRDKIWAVKSQLEIPLRHVVAAEIDPSVVEKWRYWKAAKSVEGATVIWGTNVTGVIKAGSFYVDGQWTFWDVHDPKQAITIKLADEHYTKLVLEVTDPDVAVTRIEEAVRAYKSSRRKEYLMSMKDRSHCFLSVEEGKQQGQVYALHQEVTRIGRTAGNDFLLSDPTVSPHHARILRLGDGTYGIEDLRSMNGVALGEHMLEVGEIVPLQDGDRIQLGEVVLIFYQQ